MTDPLRDAATFPVWHETTSVDWQPEAAPSLAEVDVAIVGGGLSGLWTAFYLAEAEPRTRIAVVEARRIGFGASGRNGGWCSGFFPLLPDELADRFGRDAALAAYRESFASIDEVQRVVESEGIECQFHRGGTIQSASTPVQASRLREVVRRQHHLGMTRDDLRWLSSVEVREHLHLAETYGAIFSPHCATVNPHALVIGLARVLRARGVHLWEDTVVHEIRNGVVEHDHGHVRAALVVQATEGYSNGFRQTKRRVVPLYSLMVATEPLSAAAVSDLGWTNRITFNDGGNMVIYAQLTADNRIAFGGRGAPYHFASRVRDSFDLDTSTHRRITESIARHFPAAADARITHRWGGPLGVPRDWIPTMTLDKAARYARLGGYTGDGVAATNLFARMLVDTWHQRDTPLTRLPFIDHHSPRWEPEPFRFLGINALLKLSESIDSHEARHGASPRIRQRIFDALL